MAKSREQIKAQRKSKRALKKEANAGLKLTKNWYPIANKRVHFVRKSRAPRAQKLRSDIKPGQVLILLSGRFRGKRVIFLQQLKSGLLLVTGPYKLNGVPLKRVNQAYVIATKTHVNIGQIKHLENVNDAFFGKTDEEKNRTDFFETDQKKRSVIIFV
jgi:large subunit ribosomal protein L6e